MAVPVGGIVTFCVPEAMPQSPSAVISTVTASAVCGAGLAVRVKTALPPSVMSAPAAMPTSDISVSPPDTASVKAPVCPVAAVVASIV